MDASMVHLLKMLTVKNNGMHLFEHCDDRLQYHM